MCVGLCAQSAKCQTRVRLTSHSRIVGWQYRNHVTFMAARIWRLFVDFGKLMDPCTRLSCTNY